MMIRRTARLLRFACGLGLASALAAAVAAEVDYSQVAAQRAAKIVETLGLTDATRTDRIAAIIARQYSDLHAIHAERDATGAGKKDPAVVAATKVKTDALHREFLARLQAELTPEQVEQVKDGMTYGVLPLTFRVYQEMLPKLTAEQRNQIHAWLVEARENAMDAGTSDEKHAWFGKYKGRINNYLAAAGIDMKQAEKDMLARQKNPASPPKPATSPSKS